MEIPSWRKEHCTSPDQTWRWFLPLFLRFSLVVATSSVATLFIATLIVDALLVVTLIATPPIGVWLATLHLALNQPQFRAVYESTNSTFVESFFFMKNLKFVQCHLVCFSLFEVAAGSIIAHYPRIKPNTSLFLAFLFHLIRWWRNILNQSGKVRINMFFTGHRSP